MKKIIIPFIISFLLYPFSTFAYLVDLNVTMKNINDMPISGKVIDFYTSNGGKSLKLVTNDNGKTKVEFDYNDEVGDNGESFSMNINGNYIFVKDFSPNNSNINIIYSNTDEKVVDVVGVTSKISNQEIQKMTNYKGLILFFLFTAISFSIMFGGMLFYKLMNRDIINYQK